MLLHRTLVTLFIVKMSRQEGNACQLWYVAAAYAFRGRVSDRPVGLTVIKAKGIQEDCYSGTHGCES